MEIGKNVYYGKIQMEHGGGVYNWQITQNIII